MQSRLRFPAPMFPRPNFFNRPSPRKIKLMTEQDLKPSNNVTHHEWFHVQGWSFLVYSRHQSDREHHQVWIENVELSKHAKHANKHQLMSTIHNAIDRRSLETVMFLDSAQSENMPSVYFEKTKGVAYLNSTGAIHVLSRLRTEEAKKAIESLESALEALNRQLNPFEISQDSWSAFESKKLELEEKRMELEEKHLNLEERRVSLAEKLLPLMSESAAKMLVEQAAESVGLKNVASLIHPIK